MKETIEGNKLIAEFMGYSLDKNNEYHIGEHPFTDPGGYGLMSERYDYKPDCLRFNYSWDWLMPVVEKISGIDSHPTDNWEIHAAKTDVLNSLCEVNIHFTWEAVIEFIKTYNNEK